MRTSLIRTSHAELSVVDSEGKGLPILLIHGNSSCKEVFRNQLNSPLADKFRLIAVDLPGHGASSDAFDPMRSYRMSGYAEAMIEVLGKLGIEKAAVYGWSLGGHAALEMIPRFPGLVGLMLSATPPVHPTPEAMMGGFRMHPVAMMIGQATLSDDERELFAQTIYGTGVTDDLRAALRRADGRARQIVLATAFDGTSSDQRTLAETTRVPLAMVNGADDPIVNVDYIGGLTYPSLWEKHCFAFRGVGHSAFLTHPALFNPVFERFAQDMTTLAARRPSQVSRSAVA